MAEVDMHFHSCYSDGADDPEKIVYLAKKLGLKGLCLADHDVYQGIGLLLDACRAYGIEAIPAIEVGSKYRGGDVHILGYGINCDDELLKGFFQRQWKVAERRSSESLRKYIQAGILPENTTIEEIGRTMGSKGPWVSTMHIRAYRAKVSGAGFFETINEIARGGVAYPEWKHEDYLTPMEAIQSVLRLGGVPVLAHPEEIFKRTNDPSIASEILEEVLEMFQGIKIKGLEAFHSKHTPERAKHYVELAKRRGFLITGGSDYHGSFKPHIPLGIDGVSFEEFMRFKRICER